MPKTRNLASLLGHEMLILPSSSPDSHSAAAATTTNGAPNPTATASLSSSATPSNFPLGNYSMVTFLDTVQTNCTANAATWTCYPYTIYNTSPSKSVATFNWVITSPSSGKYQISSTDNPFSIEFKNTDLDLLDQGKSTERGGTTFNYSRRRL